MAFEFLLYIAAIMIFYDLLLHLIDLKEVFKGKSKKPFFAIGYLFDYLSKEDKIRRETIYQIFWSIYWTIALSLILVYFILS